MPALRLSPARCTAVMNATEQQGVIHFTRLATERAGRGIRGDLASAEQAWAAAMTLLPSQRAEFIRNVRRRLGRRPTNGDVQQAIAAELSLNRSRFRP